MGFMQRTIRYYTRDLARLVLLQLRHAALPLLNTVRLRELGEPACPGLVHFLLTHMPLFNTPRANSIKSDSRYRTVS